MNPPMQITQFPEESRPVALAAAQMLMNGMPQAAIRFFLKIYPMLNRERLATCTEMAKHYGCSPQAATKHIVKLQAGSYLNRVHYRAWALNRRKLEDIAREGEYL